MSLSGEGSGRMMESEIQTAPLQSRLWVEIETGHLMEICSLSAERLSCEVRTTCYAGRFDTDILMLYYFDIFSIENCISPFPYMFI